MSIASDEEMDNDNNMATMSEILIKNRKVNLVHLILNRRSFGQTVENLQALSYLIKAGRAEIKVDDDGRHLVFPRNPPTTDEILSGEVSNSHFIVQLDFKNWKLMSESIEVGKELMPHRSSVDEANDAQPDGQREKCDGDTNIKGATD